MNKLIALTTAIALAISPMAGWAAAPPPAGFGTNFLVNPWMEIDQPNEGASITDTRTAAGTFTLNKLTDGWSGTAAQSTTGSPTVLMQNSALAPNGSVSDLKWTQNGTVSTTHADGTLVTIEQRIEPSRLAPLQYGTGNAQGSYLSFCAKASVAGTYGFYIAGGTSARTSDIAGGTFGSSYFHAFSVPTANQFSCYQFFIPGDTGGTWLFSNAANAVDATHGATLGFVLGINGVTTTAYGVPTASAADGAWFNTTATNVNVIGNNSTYTKLDTLASATFELTGVKWSLETSALTHNPDQELRQAQRYYWKTFMAGTGGQAGVAPAQNVGIAVAKGFFPSTTAQTTASVATGFSVPFPVQMRSAPAVTTYNPTSSATTCADITNAATGAATIEPAITSNVTNTAGVTIGCAAMSATAADRITVGLSADSRL